jgi:ABC-type phosphate/phosphonate transport system substrate-binding protein
MPVVVSTRLPEEKRARLRDIFLSLGADAEAAPALRALHVEGFTAPHAEQYEDAARTFAGGR